MARDDSSPLLLIGLLIVGYILYSRGYFNNILSSPRTPVKTADPYSDTNEPITDRGPPASTPTVPTPPAQSSSVPPIPSGIIIWTSANKWNNGRARSISAHRQRDPDDPTLYVAAGTGRNLSINGKGSALLSGARSRVYILAKNYNAQMDVTFVMNPTLDNLSLRLRSRHEEADPPDNRFGGYGGAVYHNAVEIAREDYHNVHATSLGKRAIPRALQDGKQYTVRIVVKDVQGGVSTSMFVDYDGNGVFTPIGEGIDKSPKPYMINKALHERNSYAWIRTNGGSPRNVELRKVVITTLG